MGFLLQGKLSQIHGPSCPGIWEAANASSLALILYIFGLWEAETADQ